jgi:hypothetical protein
MEPAALAILIARGAGFLFFECGKEADAATCLDLISFTDQGIRKVTHSPEGAKAATCG